MRDKDLYARIPGIKSPWQVSSVELDVTEGDVTAEVEQEVGMRACCPGSGKESPGYDSRRRRWRRWRQLDSCQYMTITLAVSRLMKLSWNAIDGIMQSAVERGLSRREEVSVAHPGIDETSFRKRHDYVTVVTDQQAGTVMYVGEGRKKEGLKDWYGVLSEERREAIESVLMDMRPACINATLESVPGAQEKIAFDKFHVARYLGLAVDKVGCQEHKALMKEGYEDLKEGQQL